MQSNFGVKLNYFVILEKLCNNSTLMMELFMICGQHGLVTKSYPQNRILSERNSWAWLNLRWKKMEGKKQKQKQKQTNKTKQNKQKKTPFFLWNRHILTPN